MMRNGRLWVGVTLLVVLVLNYAIIGFPLMRKGDSIKEKTRALLIKQVQTRNVLAGSEDEYILELFRKEKVSIDRKLSILNSVVISLLIIIISWTIFGIITHKR